MRVAQLIKKAHFHFCRTQGPLQCSEYPITGPYIQQAGFSIYSFILYP